jgi:hypothetical protein
LWDIELERTSEKNGKNDLLLFADHAVRRYAFRCSVVRTRRVSPTAESEMKVLVTGQAYDLRKLHFAGIANKAGLPAGSELHWIDWFRPDEAAPQDAPLWIYLGPDVEGYYPTFLGWQDFGFTPSARNQWENAGVDNPDTAAQLRTAGIGPDIVADWHNREQVELAQIDSFHLGELIGAIFHREGLGLEGYMLPPV